MVSCLHVIGFVAQLVVACTAAASTCAQSLGHDTTPLLPSARVRTVGPEAAALLGDGVARSPTLAQLVSDVNQTELLVRVELASFLKSSGDISIISATSAFRYLRIRVRIPAARTDLIVALAHELRHAIEIAGDPDARDESAVRRLYARIGRADWKGDHFETRAAQETGWRVRDELTKPCALEVR